MNKGDIVMIYDDPITQTSKEGKAELLKQEMDGDPEFWRVKFLSDGFVTARFIATESR